jgi:hypothetical protein
MYERIARELERERANVRTLRKDLDEERARTAKQRRTVAVAAATNGHTAAEESPGPSTPGGRASRQRAALAARAGADQRMPNRRLEAARAAAAQRVPEHEPSATAAWATRAAAVAVVAVLLVAMLLIVTSVL